MAFTWTAFDTLRGDLTEHFLSGTPCHPMGIPWDIPRASFGRSMATPWEFHGRYIDIPLAFHKRPMMHTVVIPWNIMGIPWDIVAMRWAHPVGIPWAFFGNQMGHPMGHPTGIPWASRGIPWPSHPHPVGIS